MKSICVYCGSSSGKSPSYVLAAKRLAEVLVKRQITLVYGGASVGIMGEIADAVLRSGGKVIGVMPQVLIDKEVFHPGITELQVVDSMHERKALMNDLADGFIALPGGLGTLEELFEILTWSQLDIHRKPCALLNVNSYYDHLLTFLDHAVNEQLINSSHKDKLLVEQDPGVLVELMLNYAHHVT